MSPNATTMPRGKKLIEVDLPLGIINANTGRENTGAKGHPWTLQQWWARRRLTACRVVIFASMVDDPSTYLDDPSKIDVERRRLHRLIECLSLWKNNDNERLLNEARYEIARSVARQHGETAPTEPAEVLAYLGNPDKNLNIYDPFSGGGCIPLEAQRLGLRATGTDLNPVAVLITKALIELPSQFANHPPSNPDTNPIGLTVGQGGNAWRGAAGLASDIRYYGRRMREMAYKTIGHLYPKVMMSNGNEATILAWFWARTLPCPNPVCSVHTPLVSTFQLSSKPGNEYWIKPIVNGATQSVSFTVQNHKGGVREQDTASSKGALCLSCRTPLSKEYLHEKAIAASLGEQMIAIIADGKRKRQFLSPTDKQIQTATTASPSWRPTQAITNTPKVSALGFGITHWHQMFNDRQLTALTTFTDLLREIRAEILDDGTDTNYANAICTYLALAIDKAAVAWSRFGVWHKGRNTIEKAYRRQAISMVWDYPEANPFSDRMQSWTAQVEHIANVVERLPASVNSGTAHQVDAATAIYSIDGPVIVTDPPYYNNIDYADLSDYLYVWLRHALRDIYPDLFAGILTPKNEEMTAIPSRFENATERFENLLRQTLQLMKRHCNPEFPSSIFYAYKQQEEEREGGWASTGWETMLSALVTAGFQIVGTWPIRTEQTHALKSNANVLASSVILVCRPRPDNAPMASRNDFLTALSQEIPIALDHLTRESHIAPVDLRQAAIGPGMAVYSRFCNVDTLSGEPVTVRQALAIINDMVDDYLQQQAGSMDNESRFCLDWLRAHRSGEGRFGDAEGLARPYGLAIKTGLEQRHRLLTANQGKVKLLDIDSYNKDRDLPRTGVEMTTWEGCLRMAWEMQPGEDRRGVDGCVAIAQHVITQLDNIEGLARILYDIYDKYGDSARAVAFNNVVVSWNDITTQVAQQWETEAML